MIQGLRYGRIGPGQSRIIFDLGKPVKVAKSFLIPLSNRNGFRLVIDLIPQNSSDFKEDLSRLARHQKVPGGDGPDPTVLKSNVKPEKGEKFSIVIDPGHGGLDPGAIGVSGTLEKDITLEFARQLKMELGSTDRYMVHLTRNDDRFVSLRDRVSIARGWKVNLFISIHGDANSNGKLRGASIFTLSENASDEEANTLLERESRTDILAGVDLTAHDTQVASIILDLTQRETMNYSMRFAEILVPELRKATRTLNKPHRFAGFRVLRAPDVPSVLITLGNLSNPQDEKIMTSGKELEPITKAIVRGIGRYVAILTK